MSVLQELVSGAYSVCRPCGLEYGQHSPKGHHESVLGHCDICDRDDIEVTEFRDYGYERKLKPRETFKKDILKHE